MRMVLLGAGAIGVPLGIRILQADYELAVYNRTLEKTAVLQRLGARADTDVSRLVVDAECVLSTLTDVTVLEALFFAQGAIGALSPNAVLIDCSTSLPHHMRAVEERFHQEGIRFVAAPLAGSVHDVSQGQVSFMVGGEPAAVEAVRPVLMKLGRQMISFGSVECASGAKLALNVLVGAMATGLGEAFALCGAGSIDIGLFLQTLAGSGLASPLYERLGARCLAGDYAARFALKHLQKDVGYAASWARGMGVPHDMATLVGKRISALAPELLDADYSVLSALGGSTHGTVL